jgi:rhomboid family GlyGly-CTERM serine protease
MKRLKKYSLTAMLALLISALFLLVGSVPDALVFNKEAVIQGEYWRLLTAHLVHSDWEHLLWNLSALLIVSTLIEQYQRGSLIIALLGGIIVTDVYLWHNTLGVVNYAGLSAVLNTVLVVALYQLWQHSKQLLQRVILVATFVGSLLKIIWEMQTSSSLLTSIEWQSLPEAHLAGFIMGSLLVLIQYLLHQLHTKHNVRLIYD